MRSITISPVTTASDLRSSVAEHLQTFGIQLKPSDSITLCSLESFGSTSCPPNTVQTGIERQLMVLHVRQDVFSLVQGLIPGNPQLNAQVMGRIEPV